MTHLYTVYSNHELIVIKYLVLTNRRFTIEEILEMKGNEHAPCLPDFN